MGKKKSSRHSMPEIEKASLPIRSSFAEVLPMPPARDVLDTRLRELIEQKLAEMMGGDAGLFEPFFQPKKIADEIRKLQTVPQQRKWQHYFLEFGCLICRKKNRAHTSNGMCSACRRRTDARLRAILRTTEKERPTSPPFTPDRMTDLALSALAKSTPLIRDLTEIAQSALRRRRP
jgi:hypothetical protein